MLADFESAISSSYITVLATQEDLKGIFSPNTIGGSRERISKRVMSEKMARLFPGEMRVESEM